GIVRQWSVVGLDHAPQYLRLAFRPIRGTALGEPDRVGMHRALGDDLENPAIERIDSGTAPRKLVPIVAIFVVRHHESRRQREESAGAAAACVTRRSLPRSRPRARARRAS